MRVLFPGVIFTIYAFIAAPLIVVIVVSFNSGNVASLPIEGFSLRWYANALETRAFVRALGTSLWLAITATMIAMPIALAAAVAIAQGDFRGRAAMETFFMTPLLVPGLVIGIALLVSFSALQVRDAPLRLLAGHVLIALPYCIRTILASLTRMDRALIEGAQTLGADDFTAFRLITLPLAAPGIIAGTSFAFLQSFGDVPISLFLIDARNATLPITIMSYLEYSVDPTVAAMSSMITIASFAVALVIERLVGLRRALG